MSATRSLRKRTRVDYDDNGDKQDKKRKVHTTSSNTEPQKRQNTRRKSALNDVTNTKKTKEAATTKGKGKKEDANFVEQEVKFDFKMELPDICKDLPVTETTPEKDTNIKKEMTEEVEVKREGEASLDEETEDSDDELCDLEKRRLQNLRDNADFLAKLGMSKAKIEFQEAIQNPKKKSSSNRGFKDTTKKAKVTELLPRRKSMRLQRVDPAGVPLPPVPDTTPAADEYVVWYKPRKIVKARGLKEIKPQKEKKPKQKKNKWAQNSDQDWKLPRPSGPLNMKEVISNIEDEELHSNFLTSLRQLADKSITKVKLSLDLKDFTKQVQKMTIRDEGVAKVVPNRIFSMAIHPTPDKTLVVAGGKWGKLGIWDVESDEGQDGVYTYSVHSRPVRHIMVPTHMPDHIYSCSYDGSVRCGHIGKEVFEEVYAVPEEEDILLFSFDFLNPQSLLIGSNDGHVSVVDTRAARKDIAKADQQYQTFHRTVRSVSVHPTNQNIFATAHLDGSACIWDIRSMNSKKDSSIVCLPTSRSIESAYFSPLTGHSLLVTSMEDRINIYNTTHLDKTVSLKHSIKHDNHTGRWLTNFRASWHPSRDDCFLVGSMSRPRRIELFSESGHQLHNYQHEDFLGSVCSLNVFHPSRNVLAGGNSSGRVHVFK